MRSHWKWMMTTDTTLFTPMPIWHRDVSCNRSFLFDCRNLCLWGWQNLLRYISMEHQSDNTALQIKSPNYLAKGPLAKLWKHMTHTSTLVARSKWFGLFRNIVTLQGLNYEFCPPFSPTIERTGISAFTWGIVLIIGITSALWQIYWEWASSTFSSPIISHLSQTVIFSALQGNCSQAWLVSLALIALYWGLSLKKTTTSM